MFSIKKGQRLILASSSPRRRELLKGLGLQFEVVSADIDETQLANETPQAMVLRLANQKAQHVAALHPDAWVLAADTTVVLDGAVLGKPEDKSDAIRVLSLLQGRTHRVLGGVALMNLSRKLSKSEIIETLVKIMALSPGLIKNYVESGEPMDKAGSYGIQGIGAGLVEEVKGSYTNVVGLNIAAVISWLEEFKILEQFGE